MYMGRNGVYGGNVEIITITGIYKMSLSVQYISGGQMTSFNYSCSSWLKQIKEKEKLGVFSVVCFTENTSPWLAATLTLYYYSVKFNILV
jgi:hypothetical protein